MDDERPGYVRIVGEAQADGRSQALPRGGADECCATGVLESAGSNQRGEGLGGEVTMQTMAGAGASFGVLLEASKHQ